MAVLMGMAFDLAVLACSSCLSLGLIAVGILTCVWRRVRSMVW